MAQLFGCMDWNKYWRQIRLQTTNWFSWTYFGSNHICTSLTQLTVTKLQKIN